MKIKATKQFLIFIHLLFASIMQAQTIEGLWESYHDETGLPLSRILISKNDEGIVGTVEDIFFQPWEGNNPKCYYCEGERYMQEVVGMEILWDYIQKGNNWVNGKILDPSSGKTYSSKIWLEGDQLLKVRAYQPGIGFLHRTQTWELVKRDKNESGVIGIWNAIDDESGLPSSQVKLYIQNRKLKGKIIEKYIQPWEGPSAICLSCNGDLKGKRIIGMKIIYDFETSDQSTDHQQWVNGKVMDPANGKTYNSSIWLEDKDTLKLRGYWGPFHRTQTWKRVSSLSNNVN